MEAKRIKYTPNPRFNLPICEELEKAIDGFNRDTKIYFDFLLKSEELKPISYLVNTESGTMTKIEQPKTELELTVISLIEGIRDHYFSKFTNQKKA